MTQQYYEDPPSFYTEAALDFAQGEILPYAQLFARRDRLTIFDCGANRGIWTKAVVTAFPGVEIDMHLFEPSTKNCNFMRDETHGYLWSRGDFRTLNINQKAVGAEPGNLELYTEWDGSKLGSLVKRPDLPNLDVEKVQVTTLDEYCSEKGIEHIDLLKLDVEGWELSTLNGARQLLEQDAISAIMFEFSQINVYTRIFFHDFWTLLNPLGFEFLHLFAETGQLTPISAYDGRWEMFWGTTHFFARRRALVTPVQGSDSVTIVPRSPSDIGPSEVWVRGVRDADGKWLSPACFSWGEGWEFVNGWWGYRGQTPSPLVCRVIGPAPNCVVLGGTSYSGEADVSWHGATETVSLTSSPDREISIRLSDVEDGQLLLN